MNLYIRYFDDETLCHDMSEVQDFLEGLGEINVTPKMLDDIADYVGSAVTYPKRMKTNARNFFIMIKTPLDTLAEFHANGKNANGDAPQAGVSESKYDEMREGWYRCEKKFKRMVCMEGENNKMSYVDSSIEVLIYANTPRECHMKVVDYLRSRPDIDHRSQYPALKDANFSYEYKGTTLS